MYRAYGVIFFWGFFDGGGVVGARSDDSVDLFAAVGVPIPSKVGTVPVWRVHASTEIRLLLASRRQSTICAVGPVARLPLLLAQVVVLRRVKLRYSLLPAPIRWQQRRDSQVSASCIHPS